MKGGDAIAAGSQGCVFAPRLVKDGTLARTSTVPANSQIASKVFTEAQVFRDEMRISDMLRDVSAEGLLTIHPDPDIVSFVAPDGLNAPERASAAPLGLACEVASNPGQVYVMHMPRIDGDIQGLAQDSKPITFLTKASNALMRMKHKKIIHGDMARRNIFYKGPDALIGDFGFSMNLANPDPATNGFNAFMSAFMNPDVMRSSSDILIAYSLTICLRLMDQLSIETNVALYIYQNWENRNEIINVFEDTSDESILYDDIQSGSFDIDPNFETYKRQGILMLDGTRCIDNVRVIMLAARTSTKEEFWDLITILLLNSDIKQFMQSAIKYINIPFADKERLLMEISYNSNYLFFYRYAHIEIPHDILRKIPHDLLTPAEREVVEAMNAGAYSGIGRKKQTHVHNRRRRHNRRNKTRRHKK